MLGEPAAGAVVSPETARELRALNPRVRIEHVPQTGHGIPFDQPERLATAVRSFLHSAAAA